MTTICFAFSQVSNGVTFHRLQSPGWAFEREREYNVVRAADIAMVPFQQWENIDVVVVSRLASHLPGRNREAIDAVKVAGTTLVVDIDDSLQMPSYHPNYQAWKRDRTKQDIMETLAAADVIWCSTLPLMDELQKLGHGHKAVHVPNTLSRYDLQWKGLEKTPSDVLRIGVMANLSHHFNLALLKPVVEQLRHMQGWKLYVMGVTDGAQADKVVELLGTKNVAFVSMALATSYAQAYNHIDLMLCPLQHIAFNRCRSNIKVLECAASRTAIMAEPYGPYEDLNQPIDAELIKACIADRAKLQSLVPAYESAFIDRHELRLNSLLTNSTVIE